MRRVGWVVVFTGVAVAALGLVSLGEWWDLSLRLHESDLQVDYDQLPEQELLHPLRQLSGEFTAEPFKSEPGIPDLGLAITVLLTLVGWALSLASRRGGRIVMQTAVVVGVVVCALHVRDWMTFGFPGIRCGPESLPSTRTDFAAVQLLGAQLGVLCAFVFVLSKPTVTSLLVGVFGAATLAAPLLFDADSAVVVVIATATAGAIYAALFQRELPLFALVSSVCVGALGVVTAIVMQHDARVVALLGDEHRKNLHAPIASYRSMRDAGHRDTRLTAERCEAAQLAPLFSTHDGVSFMGVDYPRPVNEDALYTQVAEIVAFRKELGLDPRITVNVEADSTLAIPDLFAILRAVERTGAYDSFTLVFLKIDAADVWSRPSRHEHACGLEVLISEDGLGENGFKSFEELFNVAARGGLKLNVKQAFEDEGH